MWSWIQCVMRFGYSNWMFHRLQRDCAWNEELKNSFYCTEATCGHWASGRILQRLCVQTTWFTHHHHHTQTRVPWKLLPGVGDIAHQKSYKPMLVLCCWALSVSSPQQILHQTMMLCRKKTWILRQFDTKAIQKAGPGLILRELLRYITFTHGFNTQFTWRLVEYLVQMSPMQGQYSPQEFRPCPTNWKKQVWPTKVQYLFLRLDTNMGKQGLQLFCNTYFQSLGLITDIGHVFQHRLLIVKDYRRR